MSPEDIHELLNRLGIFPKPYPRTIEGVVKTIERQRWSAIQGENEGCASKVSQMTEESPSTRGLGVCIVAAIRARVKS